MPYIEILLILYVIIREVMAYRERQEMLDRLMSKDLSDFKVNTEEEYNEILDDNDNTVPILEAREDMLDG